MIVRCVAVTLVNTSHTHVEKTHTQNLLFSVYNLFIQLISRTLWDAVNYYFGIIWSFAAGAIIIETIQI